MRRRPDTQVIKLKEAMARLSDREIALLMLNVRRDQAAFPLSARITQTIVELARQELTRRREPGTGE
jgi:hypothetical protein